MKILVDSNIVSYATPGVFSGFSASLLDPKLMPVYDSFDIVNPDIYIGSLANISESIIRNIEERPALKTCFVRSQESDNEAISNLNKRIGNSFLLIDDIAHADVIKYYKKSKLDFLKSDLVCIEEDFIENIESFYFKPSLRYKIFSDKRIINHNNYCGVLPDQLKASALNSSTYAIVDAKNRTNCYLCDCWPITSLCDAQNEIETDYTINIKEAKESILSGFTNFHTLSSVVKNLGYDREAKVILEKLKEIL